MESLKRLMLVLLLFSILPFICFSLTNVDQSGFENSESNKEIFTIKTSPVYNHFNEYLRWYNYYIVSKDNNASDKQRKEIYFKASNLIRKNVKSKFKNIAYLILANKYIFEADAYLTLKFARLSSFYSQNTKDEFFYTKSRIIEASVLGNLFLQEEASKIFFSLLKSPNLSDDDRVNIYLCVSIIFLMNESNEKSISFSRKAIQLTTEKDTKLKGLILESYALINLKRYDLAFERIREVNNISHNDFYLFSTYDLKSQIYADKKNYLLALNYINRSIHHLQLSGYKYLMPEILISKANILIKLGKTNEAILMIEEVLKLAETYDLTEMKAEGTKLGFELYKQLNKNDKALEYLEKYTEVNNLITKEKQKNTIFNLESNYESKIKNQKFKIIAKNNVILRNNSKFKELKISRFNIIITSLIVLFLLTIIGTYSIIKINTRKNKLKLNLLENQIELNELQSEIKGQESERSRISQELHDGVGNKLLSLIYTKENITDSSLLTIYNDIRNISHDLSASIISNQSIDELTQFLITQTFHENFKNIYYSFYPNSSKIVFDQKKQLSYYRILQELFANILKHSDASELEITYLVENNNLILTLVDNGKGFDSKSDLIIKNGIGMINLYDRVKYLHSEIYIDSQINHGTTIILKTPIKQNSIAC